MTSYILIFFIKIVFNLCEPYYLYIKYRLLCGSKSDTWRRPSCTSTASFCFLLSCPLMSGKMVHTFWVIFPCFKIKRHNLPFSVLLKEPELSRQRGEKLGVGTRSVGGPEMQSGGWGRKGSIPKRKAGSLCWFLKQGWDLWFLNLLQPQNSWEVFWWVVPYVPFQCWSMQM